MDHQAFAQLLGNYGEFIGGIAVILTLGYLAIQVRQGTRVARSSVRQSIADSISASARSLSESDDLARLMQKVFDGDDLEPHEKTRVQARCYAAFRSWENVFHQYVDGLVTDSEWKAYRQNLHKLLENNIYREVWKQFEVTFSVKFRDEVNLHFPSHDVAARGSDS